MRKYKPCLPFNVPFTLMVPTTKKVKGVATKTLSEGRQFFGSIRTFGGKDAEIDGVYTVLETATVDTWYSPDIKSNCVIRDDETGQMWEIIGAPDDIDRRHQYLQFKVKSYGRET